MIPKAKKKGEKVLLLPGADGWEAWTGLNGAGLNLVLRSGTTRVLDVGGIPTGELTMAFPVRDVSALPFRAPTSDDALLSDLSEMHLERMGMRPGMNAGVLSDVFKVGTRGEESLVVPVVLAPPREGHLPRRSPQHFDISARCLPLPADGVVVWRELGRWVFALSEEGQALEFEALASNQLGEDAGREISLTLIQLQLQGVIDSPPRHCFVWVGDEETAPGTEELEALGMAAGLGGPATVATKPAPVIPARSSQLLPADVRAERVARRKKQQTVMASAAAVLLYLGLIFFLVFDLAKAKRGAEEALVAYTPFADVHEDGMRHEQKWRELQPVVEQDHNTVELLYHCMRARGGEEGVRLDRADISNQLDVQVDGETLELTIIRSIRLQGKSDELGQATAFDEALKGERGLNDYQWTTPPPQAKGDKWSFQYEARLRGPEEQ